jgi:uncharacterized protein
MLERLDRWSRWTVLLTLLLLPWAIYSAVTLPVGSAAVHEWLPDGLPEKQRYEQFLKQFGDDQFLLVSWDGCRINDLRIDHFSAALRNEPAGNEPLIAGVESTRDALARLMEPPLSLPPQQAAQRLFGFLLGRDGTAAVIVRFTEAGIAQQKPSMAHVLGAADAVPGLGADALRMAGTIYESYAVDQAAESSLNRLVVPSCLLGVVVAWLCLRSIRGAVTVLVIGGIGQLLAIASVVYTGGEFSAVLIVLPTLVFMLTLSGAVHLMHYFRDVAAWHADHRGSRAMLLGFAPSLSASLTTSLGMAALAISQLGPVREFGLYSAFSLIAATAFMLLGFPWVADVFCSRALRVSPRERDEAAEPDPQLASAAGHPRRITPGWARYTGRLGQLATAISAAGILLVLGSTASLLHLRTSTSFVHMFPPESPTVRDMRWLEEHLGPIASIEVLIEFPHDTVIDTYTRVEWVQQIAQRVATSDEVGAVMSAVTYLPELPRTGSLRDVARRSALRRILNASIGQLLGSGWLAENSRGQVWRVTAKVSALTSDNYSVLTQRVRHAVDSLAEEVPQRLPFTVEYTGVSPVMHETQMMLLGDLGSSFSTAFLLITPVMMLIVRGFWGGLLIMIPNVLPVTLVFAVMAWLDLRLDIAGTLTASVAIGIAVNDTLHFVNWYARRLALGDSRSQAVADALTSCAPAMLHTMLISCFSMLPFLLADFLPTRQFACLMIAMLTSALVSDFVLLPALLLSPLGRCVRSAATATPADAPTPANSVTELSH